jgi:DNA repair protein RecN (Recombination protein N)
MLTRLFIQNYAIIDEIDISYSPKLNIITGETGAGKSILVGALSLILGNRADSTVLLNKEKKCVIEGFFDLKGKEELKSILNEADLDPADELVIRREISANGKSRAFVNDSPVNLEQLRVITSLLVDLHQQFDTLDIADSGFQREVIDALGGNSELLKTYQLAFKLWSESKKQLSDLQNRKQQFQKEFDYYQFLFNELEDAALHENELEELDVELKLQSNAEAIKTNLSSAVYQLSESDQPVVQQVKTLIHQLQAFGGYQHDMPDLIQRLESTQIELADIASELERVNNHIQFDPQRIERINERLTTGYKLLKKHGVQSTAQLISIQRELSQKLQSVLNIDEEIIELEKKEITLHKELRSLADKLHEKRTEQIKPLQQDVNQLLKQVGMPNASIKVQVQSLDQFLIDGADRVDFLFDANKSNQFMPVGKVASGGELSRLMLCIKSLVAKKIDLPTMIFDEIDSGISGEAARQVGIIMKDLANMRQVICITHLPQIAGKANAHFFVFKEIINEKVKTNIRLLTEQERITTIAKMLSGEKPTAAAMENAREMVMN